MNILTSGNVARSIMDGIESKIADLRVEIKQTREANLTPEETRVRVKSLLNEAMFNQPPGNHFEHLQSVDSTGYHPLTKISISDLCYIFGEENIADRIMARIVANGQKVGAPLKQRSGLLADLAAKLKGLERECEIEACRLEASGDAVVLRRVDADIEVILGVWATLGADGNAEVPAGQSGNPAATPADPAKLL